MKANQMIKISMREMMKRILINNKTKKKIKPKNLKKAN